ncbi:hypothetical protein KAU51_04235 [Candidatus Parcubacteria bacterium]|nr:hypothetical protein [Candidatus Parcubacteria bacterium]
MSEIIIGALVTLLTQGFKWLVKRYGYDATQSAILISVFVISLTGALLYEWRFITPEMIETSLRISAIAIGVYEVIYKRFLKPVLDRIKQRS